MFSPLEQFKVNVLWQMQMAHMFTFSVTNVVVTCVLIISVMLFGAVVPFSYSTMMPFTKILVHEELFKKVKNFFLTFPTTFGLSFLPFITSLLYFMLLSNLVGLLPYSFTITSQIFVTFTLSISIFTGITILGIYLNKFDFVSFFMPSKVTNVFLRYFLVFIEVLSYAMRPFSLGIRLFANMLAGHTLLYMLAAFSYSVAIKFMVFSLVGPFIMIFGVMMLEFSIAFIQTYVFVVLTMLYMKDMMDTVH